MLNGETYFSPFLSHYPIRLCTFLFISGSPPNVSVGVWGRSCCSTHPCLFMQVLLRKGSNKDTQFIHAPTGCYDNELFTIIWGPTIAALSFVFDKSHDQSIVQKAIMGFRWEKFGKCEEVLHLWDRSTSAISLIDHFETRPWFNIVYLTD